jgi:hypothetical protein
MEYSVRYLPMLTSSHRYLLLYMLRRQIPLCHVCCATAPCLQNIQLLCYAAVRCSLSR